jgi:hypothetical protein
VWFEKIREKSAITVRNALQAIIARAGVSPTRIMCDNGTEFAGEFKAYCVDEHLKLVNTRSYSAQSNGIAERANRELRDALRQLFVRNANRVWEDKLRIVEDSMNSSYKAVNKATPDQIWQPNVEHRNIRDVERMNPEDVPAPVHAILESVEKKMKRFKDTEYDVGDTVRVKMSALFTNHRKMIKAGEKEKLKYIIVNYSPEIFTITRVFAPRQTVLERRSYYLMDQQNRPLVNSAGNPVRFYSGDIIAGDFANDTHLGTQQSLGLNRVRPSDTDYSRPPYLF